MINIKYKYLVPRLKLNKSLINNYIKDYPQYSQLSTFLLKDWMNVCRLIPPFMYKQSKIIYPPKLPTPYFLLNDIADYLEIKGKPILEEDISIEYGAIKINIWNRESKCHEPTIYYGLTRKNLFYDCSYGYNEYRARHYLDGRSIIWVKKFKSLYELIEQYPESKKYKPNFGEVLIYVEHLK